MFPAVPEKIPNLQTSQEQRKEPSWAMKQRFSVDLSSWWPVRTTAKVSRFKKYEADLQLLLIPLILFVVLLIVMLLNQSVNRTLERNQLASSDLLTEVHPYPFVSNVQLPTVTAKAAIILDSDSQVILFSKNPTLRFSMASTTKIMSALVGLDYYKNDSVLTVQRNIVEGAGLGLQRGERFTFDSLLYAMLLPSANDAAQTLADNYPGGEPAFVKKMNEKAESLHLTNTHFTDPTGLNDDGDYTTVVDMAHLASAAKKNKKFVEVTSTREKVIANLAYTREYPLANLNRLLGINGVDGIKTGTTEGAGEVLVTSTVENGHTYIVVVMNSLDRFTDTQTLLSFISDNVQYVLPTFSQ